MVIPEDVESALAAAATRWSTLRGVVRHHRRHDLVTIGFERYFAALDAQGWRVGAAPETRRATWWARTRVGSRVPGSEVFAMITGGDRFRLAVDDELGVLLRVVKEVDGAVAETVEFTEVEFDVPLADGLFAPIT